MRRGADNRRRSGSLERYAGVVRTNSNTSERREGASPVTPPLGLRRSSAWPPGRARGVLALSLSVLAALVLACGGGDSDDDAGGGANGDDGGSPTAAPTTSDDPLAGAVAELTLELDLRDIAFSANDLEAPTGLVVEILLENVGRLEHDFTIEELSADVSAVGQADPGRYDLHVPLAADEEARLLIRVGEAGEYTFFCAVPGHRQAGMEGRLVIR